MIDACKCNSRLAIGVEMGWKTINGVSYSKREIEVIACICNGYPTKIIAKKLKISPHTVKSYIKNIMVKTQCYSRVAIINFIDSSDAYLLIHDIGLEMRLSQDVLPKTTILVNCFANIEKPKFIQFLRCNPTKYFVVISTIAVCGVASFVFLREEHCISYEIPLINKQVFLPRVDIIKKIEKNLNIGTNLDITALVGEAGVGKTTIARSYLSNGKFSVKVEIDAESEFKLIESFEALLFLLCTTDRQHNMLQAIKSIKNIDEKRKKLKVFLADLIKQHKNWCFLYDNVDDLDILKKWIPVDGNLFKNGKIIITTRNENIKNILLPCAVNVIKVDHLSYDESEKLFCNLLRWPNKKFDHDKKLIKLLLSKIPAVPLDISSAAHFIKSNNIALDRYLELLREKGVKIMSNKLPNNLTEYDKTRELIVATTFDKILNVSESNLELLTMLCLLDSNDIHKKIFQLIASSEDVESFFYELKKYSILDEKDKSFSIHRLNQEMGLAYLLQRLPSENIRTILTKIVDALAVYNQIEWKWSKSERKMPKDQARLLIPHLESMLAKLEAYTCIEHIDEYKLRILMTLYFAYDGEISYKESYKKGRELIAINAKKKVITGQDLVLLLFHHIYVGVYSGETSDIASNAIEGISICEQIKDSDHLKMVSMLYLVRYYFDFASDYEKAKELLQKIFKFKEKLSHHDWDIVMCVFANQLYRSYESCYINDKQKMFESIGYLQQALKDKGFTENYRKDGIKEIAVDKSIFIMYAIEMMINISRAYNMIGDFDTAFENELDIKYIYELLSKHGIRFYSQEFQFNRVHGETLLRKGEIEEAHKVLSAALASDSISSEIDLFCAYVSRAEANIALGKYDEALKDCDSALNVKEQCSNYFMLKKCKCIYLQVEAYSKKGNFAECKKSLEEFWVTAKKLSESLKKNSDKKPYADIDVTKSCEGLGKNMETAKRFLDEICKTTL